MIDGHGDDLFRYNGKIRLNFSSNISQGNLNPVLKAHLVSCLDCISNYPEVAPYSIEKLLAEKLELSKDNISVTNGATEAIYIIARAFHDKCSAIFQPTFSEYADACTIAHHRIVSFFDIVDMPHNADLVWICNPNNPTGKVLDYDLINQLISHNPDILFVIDQAYHKYTKCRCFSPDAVKYHNNLILLYSMTKDYAVPGLRLGYIVANQDIIKSLKRDMMPWSINALSIECAKYLLTSSDININLDDLLAEVKFVSDAFHSMSISVTPTDTNFMLCQLPNKSASELKEYLVVKHGILIRDASNFEGLSPMHFRIAVQSHKDNIDLINAIKKWI